MNDAESNEILITVQQKVFIQITTVLRINDGCRNVKGARAGTGNTTEQAF